MISLGCGSINDINALEPWYRDAIYMNLIKIETDKIKAMNGDNKF